MKHAKCKSTKFINFRFVVNFIWHLHADTRWGLCSINIQMPCYKTILRVVYIALYRFQTGDSHRCNADIWGRNARTRELPSKYPESNLHYIRRVNAFLQSMPLRAAVRKSSPDDSHANHFETRRQFRGNNFRDVDTRIIGVNWRPAASSISVAFGANVIARC